MLDVHNCKVLSYSVEDFVMLYDRIHLTRFPVLADLVTPSAGNQEILARVPSVLHLQRIAYSTGSG